MWVVRGNKLYRAAFEAIVHATNEEKKGMEMVGEFLLDLRQDINSRRRRHEYRDIRNEWPMEESGIESASAAADGLPAAAAPETFSERTAVEPSTNIPTGGSTPRDADTPGDGAATPVEINYQSTVSER